ncbi:MAG: Na/Pi cotransporter family protein [Deltaproteobacteria bacterium]|nr:Na/Pi cotransporter family protein [Deltaproteobacteria bacterium]
MEAIGHLIGGIGVFFVGLYLLSSALKQMAGRRFRLHFAKWVGTTPKAGLVGFVAGFLTQSMSALSFIVGSLVGAGMVPVQRGMLVIFWANAGIGIMILLAVLNIKVAVLLILGIAGMAFAFKRPRHMEGLSQALFGGALLFYGLIMLRTGAEPLAAMPWFEAVLTAGRSSYLLAFLAGALLTGLCQSSTAVSILAITLTQVGIFSMEQTVMIIYGTNVGSGAVSWLLASAVRGTPKQLIMSQVFFNFIAGLVFVAWFYLEILIEIPGILALIRNLGLPLEQGTAMVYLIFNWGGAVALSFVVGPFARTIARFWPATREEEWSRTAFLRDDIGDAPEIQLGLLTKEQSRLLCRLPRYTAILLDEIRDDRGKILEALHASFGAVSREINAQIADLLGGHLTQESLELLMILQNKQKQMEAFQGLLQQFALSCRNSTATLRTVFQGSFLQGLDFLLHAACEAESSEDAEDAQRLVHLTRDKGEVFQALRAAYLNGEREMDVQDRGTFLELTGLYERIVWTLGRIAKLQQAQQALEARG